jgi:hypothetical protein
MKEIFEREIRSLDVVRNFPWEDRRTYAEFLAQTFYYICHTTRLLGLCASRIGVDREKLHHRFLRHAAEERSHHLLAERDISALGFRLDDLSELPTTAALYETQYYRVEHISATSIFGYILALEGVSVIHGPHIYEIVAKRHGEASSFVKLHAEDDPGHLDAAFDAIGGLTAEERTLIERNLSFTCQLYLGFLRAIIERRTHTST